MAGSLYCGPHAQQVEQRSLSETEPSAAEEAKSRVLACYGCSALKPVTAQTLSDGTAAWLCSTCPPEPRRRK